MKKIQTGTLLFLLACTSTGFASSTSDKTAVDQSNTALDPVIVTAQREEKRDSDTPATVTVLDEQALKNTGARTVFDALAFTQGITNFSYGPGGQDYGAMDSRVVIRGFDRGALILINGAPINLLNKNSLDNIPLETVQRIEIVKGASSTLYGAEAFGGVINIITKKTGAEQASTTLSTGNLGYKNYAASYMNPEFSFFYDKQYFGAESRTSPDRPTLPTDAKARNYYQNRGKGDKQNVSFSITPTDKLNITYMRSESNNMYGTTPYWNKATDSSNQSAKINNVSYRYNDIKNTVNFAYDDKENRFKTIIFYNDRDLYGEKIDYFTHKTSVNASNYCSYNLGIDTQKSWAVRDGKDNILTGILTSKENYKSSTNSSQNATRTNYAVYGQYSYKATEKFTAILGAREQTVEDPVKNQNVFMPQMQTIYKINDTHSWYTNIGKAFEMPPLSQYYTYNKLASGKDLKPQEGWNYETGYKIINQDSSWKFALYKMDFKNSFNFIKDDTGEYVLTNMGKFRNTGFEVEYNKIINDHWSANAAFNYGNPETQDKTGTWSQVFPKMQITAGLQYTQDKWATSLSCNYLTDRQKNQYGVQIPSAVVVNAALNYKMAKTDEVTLNLNNILDKKNIISQGGYDYWDLPFNWTVSWKHNF